MSLSLCRCSNAMRDVRVLDWWPCVECRLLSVRLVQHKALLLCFCVPEWQFLSSEAVLLCAPVKHLYTPGQMHVWLPFWQFQFKIRARMMTQISRSLWIEGIRWSRFSTYHLYKAWISVFVQTDSFVSGWCVCVCLSAHV